MIVLGFLGLYCAVGFVFAWMEWLNWKGSVKVGDLPLIVVEAVLMPFIWLFDHLVALPDVVIYRRD